MRKYSPSLRILRRSFIALAACALLIPSPGFARFWRSARRIDKAASKKLNVSTSRKNEEVSESREEWLRFTLGDENGYIPPDGLARALEQRKRVMKEMAAKRIAPDNAALPSTPAGWTNLTGYVHPVGRVNDLLIHPTSTNTMWAGTDGGGIWKTTDGGVTWQAANDFLASLSISSFAMRPGDPSIIYAATGALGSHTGLGGAGIFKSIDGGTNWSQLANTSPATNSDFQFVYQLAIHPTDSNTVIAATSGGAYITTNGGGIWTEISAASTRAYNVAIHPANGNLRVIAMADGTVRIATDGSTYNPYTIAASSASYTRIALAPSDQSVMYALVYNSGTTTLYRSGTTGMSWSPISTPTDDIVGQLYYTGGLWIDPTNPNHIAVAEFWTDVTSNASVASPTWTSSNYGWVDFHGIVGQPGYNGTSNKTVFFFDDGGLYRWADVDTIGSTSPTYLSPNGIVATEAYTVAGRGGNLIFGAQDVASRYYKTTMSDATPRWRFASGLGGHDGAATAADRTNPSILYGSTQYLGIHRSIDGGASTAFICQGITDISCSHYSGSSAFIAPFVLDPNNQSRMLAGAASLWRSNDVSTGSPPTWTSIHSGVGSNISAIAVAPTNSDVIWVAYQNGNVYKTANGTAATPMWTQVTNVPIGNKLRIYVDRTNSSRVYIGLSGFAANRLVTTPDGGGMWSNVPGLPSASVFAIQQHPVNASWLYVGTAVGLFASEDGGANWSATNEGPANVQVRDLNWYTDTPPVLLVATFGRGIWRAPVEGVDAPSDLTATATSTTSVSLTWTPVTGATSYKIYRSSSYPTFTLIENIPLASYTDATAAAGTAYLYKVRANNGITDSPYSNTDLATTVIFTDPTVTSGVTTVKSAHITELRTAVNAVRTLAILGSSSFTDPTLSSSIFIQRVHITELRAALDAARSALGLPAISYAEPTITVGSTTVKAAHVNELRQGVK
jgi:photosystem II stability/assembly factor-like uncharacterized protein